MKRKLLNGLCIILAIVGGVFGVAKLAIRHDRLDLYDEARQRSIPVDIYVRRDKAMKAMAGMEKLRVAFLNHGNTVASHEYSYLANLLAARGFYVVSIQHDLPTDAPLSMSGYPYVGRLPVYERGEKNILFVDNELRKLQPNADFDKLTVVGHSNGGDISVFFAGHHPEMVAKVITFDNLRVPLSMVKAKLLSFRSYGGNFKPDPGVVPDDDECEKTGISVVRTGFDHNDMSDRGPDVVKEQFVNILDGFLNDEDLSAITLNKKMDERKVSALMSKYFPVNP